MRKHACGAPFAKDATVDRRSEGRNSEVRERRGRIVPRTLPLLAALCGALLSLLIATELHAANPVGSAVGGVTNAVGNTTGGAAQTVKDVTGAVAQTTKDTVAAAGGQGNAG